MGSPLGAHICHEPPATEGRVQAERSEPEGSLDAARAGGISDQGATGWGSVTPTPKTGCPEIIEEKEGAIKLLSPVMVDGGTRVLHPEVPIRMCPGSGADKLLLGCMRAPKDGLVELPLSGPPPGGEGRPWGRVAWSQTPNGRNVTIHVEGCVYISWGVDRGEISVEFKAPTLWRHGWLASYAYWIGELHKLLFFDDLEPDQLHEAGWHMGTIHVCADSTGWNVYVDDEKNWRGCRSTDYRRRVGRLDEDGKTETLYVGTPNSNCQVVLYDKSREIIDNKKEVLVYSPVWEAHGWNENENVQRAELRIKGKGRLFRTFQDRNSEVRYDFRDPYILHLHINALWNYWTHTKVLIIPSCTRKTNCPTDPRWKAVQAASRMSGDLSQIWRGAISLADDACQHRDRLDSDRVISGLAGILSRRHDLGELTPSQDPLAVFMDVLDGTAQGTDAHTVREAFLDKYEDKLRAQHAELGAAITIRAQLHRERLAEDAATDGVSVQVRVKRPPVFDI
mgnify:CR=1 FL=1